MAKINQMHTVVFILVSFTLIIWYFVLVLGYVTTFTLSNLDKAIHLLVLFISCMASDQLCSLRRKKEDSV